MQIEEGDIIRTINDNHVYFGHYHTAGLEEMKLIFTRIKLPRNNESYCESGFLGMLLKNSYLQEKTY